MSKANKADIFDVWGHPPKELTFRLTPKQLSALKRYTEEVTERAYRLSYDNGLVEGLTEISLAITMKLKAQRTKMLRGK